MRKTVLGIEIGFGFQTTGYGKSFLERLPGA
jgi:hypothetical protein